MTMAATRTILTFQHNAKLTTLSPIVKATHPFSSLSESDQSLFKTTSLSPNDHVVITTSTIFHPQGGGQPSDTGTISSPSTTFTVTTARTSPSGQVLHLGHFNPPTTPFTSNEQVTQTIDISKRLYYSRLHTAGHVLGAAVRHLLEHEIPGFDELKASHFPDSAACEFQGLIEGKWKEPIQKRLDEYVDKDMPVEIDWWDEEDFRREGLERLIPRGENVKLGEGEKWRVVKIVGAEVYPCGGTHVDSTRECGRVTVRKVGRSKGTSKVSYSLAE